MECMVSHFRIGKQLGNITGDVLKVANWEITVKIKTKVALFLRIVGTFRNEF